VAFTLFGAAHSLNHSLFLVVPPLLQNIAQSLSADFQLLGLITTVTFFIYGTGALVGGPLSDMLGSVRVARISIGLAGAMSLIFLVARDIYTFAAGMFLMAVWASFYHPTANKLMVLAFPRSPGNAMGIHNAAGNAGQVLTPTVAYILGVAVDWRFSFVFFGVLSMVVAFFMDRVQLEGDEAIGRSGIALGDFLKVPGIWLILIFSALVGFVSRGVEVYFPTLLRLGRGYPGETAAIGSSLILLFGVAGQLIGGRSADRRGPTRVLMIAIVGIAVSLVMLLILPDSFPVVVLFTLVYGIAIFAHQPSMTTLVSYVTPRRLMGLSFGVMFFFTFGLGSIAGFVLGWMTDAYGIVTAFWANAAVAVALVVVTVLIMNRFRGVSHPS